jgi:hypothetical protein
VAVKRGDANSVSRAHSISSERSAVSESSSSTRSGKKPRNSYTTVKQLTADVSLLIQHRLNQQVSHLSIANERTRANGGSYCMLCRWATGKKYSGLDVRGVRWRYVPCVTSLFIPPNRSTRLTRQNCALKSLLERLQRERRRKRRQ